VGIYSITVHTSGFQAVERTHVSVSVQQELKLDLSLKASINETTVIVNGGELPLQRHRTPPLARPSRKDRSITCR
jgi:hypothetical protein